MKNIKLTYIPVKKSDVFEGLSFYDNLNESFTYTTDSNKWFFKDIDINIMESKIKDIMYNSLVKIFFDKNELPTTYTGSVASEENAKINICLRFFKAYWGLVIWAGKTTDASVLKCVKEVTIPDTKKFIETLKQIDYKLPKTLSNKDIIVSKIKEGKYDEFPDSIKEILKRILPYQQIKENLKSIFWNNYYTPVYNLFEPKLDEIIGYTTRDKDKNEGFSKKLNEYFPNLTQKKLEEHVKDLVIDLVLDSQYYVYADEIIKNSKDKPKDKASKKVSGTTGNEQKDASSNKTAVKKREDNSNRVELSDAEMRERAKILMKNRGLLP